MTEEIDNSRAMSPFAELLWPFMSRHSGVRIRYDTIEEFNVDSKADCRRSRLSLFYFIICK